MENDYINMYFIQIKGVGNHYFLVPESDIENRLPMIVRSIEDYEKSKTKVYLEIAFRFEVTHTADVIEEDLRWLFRQSPDLLKITGLFPLHEEPEHLRDEKIMYFVEFLSHKNYLFIFTHTNLAQEIDEAVTELKLKEPGAPRVHVNFDNSTKIKYKDFHLLDPAEADQIFGNYFRKAKLKLIHNESDSQNRYGDG